MHGNSTNLFGHRKFCNRCKEDKLLECFSTYDNGYGISHRGTCKECCKLRAPVKDGTKECRACHQILPIDSFYLLRNTKNGKRYPNSYCKTCSNATRPDYKRGRTTKEAIRRRNLKSYGLTEETFDILLASQSNRCAICRDEFTDTKKRHIDHCHKSGKVRGILCDGCNHGIGRFKDDPELLQKAIEYLTQS